VIRKTVLSRDEKGRDGSDLVARKIKAAKQDKSSRLYLMANKKVTLT
jgi:hypothetical protein